MLKIKKVHPDAKIPLRATKDSTGLDLFSTSETVIQPGTLERIGTGVAIELDYIDTCTSLRADIQIRARSGLSSKGLILLNGVGTIDRDYRGELICPFMNVSNLPVTITKGMRIAQIVIGICTIPTVSEVSSLSETGRGTGGFGSTGTH